MFKYEFMIIAFAVGCMLAVIIPILGSNLVYKRLSLTGDALSHNALAGVAIGLIMGYNPVIVAIITCVVAALIIEFIRKKFHKYSEISIAIVLSAGVGLAGLLSSFAPTSNFNNYLFGSIVAISRLELYLTIGLFVAVLLFFILFYKEIMYINYSEQNAKIAKIPVFAINLSLTILTAITIAIASKIIGALIVSSLLVIPIASSMQVSKNYKETILFSIMFALSSVIVGLVLSYYVGVKPGGAIVLISVGILIICMLSKFIYKKLINKNLTKTTSHPPTLTKPK